MRGDMDMNENDGLREAAEQARDRLDALGGILSIADGDSVRPGTLPEIGRMLTEVSDLLSAAIEGAA